LKELASPFFIKGGSLPLEEVIVMESVLVSSSALILVGVMPNALDLEIARLLGWYRIPLRSAPKVIEVDYLAFYQTAAFGKEHQWRIESIAAVRGHELTTREELFRDEPEHPRAKDEYYKIQLGPLEKLPSPILAERWRRLTFLYTTGALLRHAKKINDLVVRSEEREILWRSLRDRALNSGTYQAETLPESMADMEPLLLAMLGNFKRTREDKTPYSPD
jgi:hypothetical protein